MVKLSRWLIFTVTIAGFEIRLEAFAETYLCFLVSASKLNSSES